MKEEGQSNVLFKTCKTDTGYYALYENRLAQHKKDICIQPVHGATWLYSSKDPGSGRENVVVATNDPEILTTHPELGENQIFNDWATLKMKADKAIEEIANTFVSWEDLYEDVKRGDFSRLSSDRIEIEWMINYFAEKEDYEKCNFLKQYENRRTD